MVISVIIDWWGPYNGIEDARKRMPMPQHWGSDAKALYMGLGSSNVCHYIGRTTGDPRKRMKESHHKLDEGAKIYVGEISSPGILGPRRNWSVSADHETAESVRIFVLKPKDNKSYKERPPENSGVVFSRLFDADYHEIPARPPPKFPILAAYDSSRDQSLLAKEKVLRRCWK